MRESSWRISRHHQRNRCRGRIQHVHTNHPRSAKKQHDGQIQDQNANAHYETSNLQKAGKQGCLGVVDRSVAFWYCNMY